MDTPYAVAFIDVRAEHQTLGIEADASCETGTDTPERPLGFVVNTRGRLLSTCRLRIGEALACRKRKTLLSFGTRWPSG